MSATRLLGGPLPPAAPLQLGRGLPGRRSPEIQGLAGPAGAPSATQLQCMVFSGGQRGPRLGLAGNGHC